jgi:endoglycosylceramidase
VKLFLGFLSVLFITACSAEAPSDATTNEQAIAASAHARRALVAKERHFVDRQGRVVILRGVNLAGNSKVPPFVPYDDAKSLDVLGSLGVNAVRVPFIWEAYEPVRGRYDNVYLASMQQVARDAWARGLHVVVDFHQDGFSRFSIGGCGSGFPAWASPPGVHVSTPDNSEAHCANWGERMFTDWDMHGSFGAFYRNDGGVRDSFIEMVSRVASAFASVEGVIGYDLLNEPWGWDSELAPFYEAEGRAIRAHDPEAILFVEAHITTNAGVPSTLARPSFENMAYAPHYYDPVTMLVHAYDGNPSGIDGAFATMSAKAAEWNVPLFVGEFGMFASFSNVGRYVTREYENLDALLASGTQWNVSPRWTAQKKDDWNGEDLDILEPQTSALRPNFRVRPYPRATTGTPISFAFEVLESAGVVTGYQMDYRWSHDGGAGTTELVLPRALFGASATVQAAGATCTREAAVLVCTGAEAGEASVRVVASAQ